MVSTDAGLELARITVINYDLEVLIDEFVMPDREILDYNTKWSGITEEILRGVTTRLSDIQSLLNKILNKNTIIIGHSLENDFHAMQVLVYLYRLAYSQLRSWYQYIVHHQIESKAFT